MKKINRTWLISTIVCLIPVIAGIALYGLLPDKIVTHWDFNGTPNGWSSKFVGAIVLPGVLVLINMAYPFLLKLDPKYKNVSEKIKAVGQWIIPAVEIFACSVTLTSGLGIAVNIPFWAMLFMGLLFTIIGNYLPKMPQSYTVGIKIPWTLHDEENWKKTHRMAGFLWVICGILIMISAFLSVGYIVFIVLLAAMIIVPTVYSYLLARKKMG